MDGKKTKKRVHNLEGIQGWLIPYLFYLFVQVIVVPLGAILIFSIVIETWKIGSPGFWTLLLGAAWFLGAIYTLILTFTKKKEAVYWNIGILIVLGFLNASSYLFERSFVGVDGYSLSSLISSWIIILIFIGYWNISTRVKNTFIR